MKPYRFTRVAVRWITRFQVRHALDAQAAATLVEIDRLKQEHERALNAHRDRIESALSAALGDPDLGAYPGDPDGAPDLESLVAMVAGLRRQRDEARLERAEMAAAGRTVVEATDEMRERCAETEARLTEERDAAILRAENAYAEGMADGLSEAETTTEPPNAGDEYDYTRCCCLDGVSRWCPTCGEDHVERRAMLTADKDSP
jgi:DNA repair exonuclease SbcCD ATPase subunit